MSNLIKLTEQEDGVGIRSIVINAECIEHISENNGPTHILTMHGLSLTVTESLEEIEALMLRDQFAMSAMNGVVTGLFAKEDGYSIGLTSVANWAYQQADAMLKARKEIK